MIEENKNKVTALPELPKMEFVFDNRKITPAKIDKSMFDFEKTEKEVQKIEELKNLNFDGFELKDIKELREEVARKKSDAESFKKDLMDYLNQDTKEINQKLIGFISRVEEVRKYLHNIEKEMDNAKREKIKNIKEFIFKDRPDYLIYLIDNKKWENKTFKEHQIEAEIQAQYSELLKKEEFIKSELEKANADLEFVITFEETKHLITEDYSVISNKITEKRNDRKDTEENLRKKAEEQAKKEAEEKIRKEQEEQKKQEQENKDNAIQKTDKNTDQVRDTYIAIKVSGLSEEATNDLLKVIKKHNLKYIKEMR